MDKRPSVIYNKWHRQGNTPDKSHESYNPDDIHHTGSILQNIWANASVAPPKVASGAVGYISKVTRQTPFFPIEEKRIIPKNLDKIIENQGGYKQSEEPDSTPVSSVVKIEELPESKEELPEPFKRKPGRPRKITSPRL